MKETIEDLFKKLGYDYNTLAQKYGGKDDWAELLKDMYKMVGVEDDKSKNYLTIKNFNKIVGKHYTHSGESFYIHSVEEFELSYDIDCEYRGTESINISVRVDRTYKDKIDEGYKIKFEANNGRHYVMTLKKEQFDTQSSFLDLIENFLMRFVIPLPF